jgi:hypothetical protein
MSSFIFTSNDLLPSLLLHLSFKKELKVGTFCLINTSTLLLLNVNRKFRGEYSCSWYNEAGEGNESGEKLLEVFYAPGNAVIIANPQIPLKRKSLVLSCEVEDLGNPKASKYRWLRGDEPVKYIETAEWTIEPVGLHSRNNFSCCAFNEGGNGTWATIDVDIQVKPTFIRKLPQYTGYLFSEPNIMLSCRVECVPMCSIYWYRDGQEINSLNDKYFIKDTVLPADYKTGDFEIVYSELVS